LESFTKYNRLGDFLKKTVYFLGKRQVKKHPLNSFLLPVPRFFFVVFFFFFFFFFSSFSFWDPGLTFFIYFNFPLKQGVFVFKKYTVNLVPWFTKKISFSRDFGIQPGTQ